MSDFKNVTKSLQSLYKQEKPINIEDLHLQGYTLLILKRDISSIAEKAGISVIPNNKTKDFNTNVDNFTVDIIAYSDEIRKDYTKFVEKKKAIIDPSTEVDIYMDVSVEGKTIEKAGIINLGNILAFLD